MGNGDPKISSNTVPISSFGVSSISLGVMSRIISSLSILSYYDVSLGVSLRLILSIVTIPPGFLSGVTSGVVSVIKIVVGLVFVRSVLASLVSFSTDDFELFLFCVIIYYCLSVGVLDIVVIDMMFKTFITISNFYVSLCMFMSLLLGLLV